ncbi:hypothetical protein GQX74_014259 [Glossina fuscipes]|nr:hypothetical protein GQX74_014259 [Glossina fuscipes]
MPTLEDSHATCINNSSPSHFQCDDGFRSRVRKEESDCHSRNRSHYHSLTLPPVGTENSQRHHNANDCSNNGHSVMGSTVLSTSLASFNGNPDIDNNGNPNATAPNTALTCHSDHNSSCNTITNSSGSV